MFTEKALGQLPFLRQHPLPFQYTVYPVHCRRLTSLDAMPVIGIVLHHLACAYPVCTVYLPEDDSPVTGCPQTVILQQPFQHFLCLAAVIGIKERGNETEEVAMHAFRLFHIVRWYATYGCLLRCPSGFSFRPLPGKREIIGSTAFGVVVEILLGSIMIPATALMVAPADRRVQRRVLFVHIVG